jgi:hypothetical protein
VFSIETIRRTDYEAYKGGSKETNHVSRLKASRFIYTTTLIKVLKSLLREVTTSVTSSSYRF